MNERDCIASTVRSQLQLDQVGGGGGVQATDPQPTAGTRALRYGGVVLGVNYAARQHTPGLGSPPAATSSRRGIMVVLQRLSPHVPPLLAPTTFGLDYCYIMPSW